MRSPKRRSRRGTRRESQVAIVKDDRVLMAKGYGVKKARGKPGAVTADTVFAIGSMSKAFTTASMAMLIATEGKMSWDDPVRQARRGFSAFQIPWPTSR